jgi:hypothetical protein
MFSEDLKRFIVSLVDISADFVNFFPSLKSESASEALEIFSRHTKMGLAKEGYMPKR